MIIGKSSIRIPCTIAVSLFVVAVSVMANDSPPLRSPRPTRQVASAAVSANPFLAVSQRRFTFAPLTVTVQNATASATAHELLEPSVLESVNFFRSCRCFHTFDYTAFMHNDHPSAFAPVIQVAQRDVTTGAAWALAPALDLGPNQPGQTIAFNQSADPVLAANPGQFGVNGYRVYLAGVTLNRDCPTCSPVTHDTQISVWYTDGGNTWSRYAGIEYHHNNTGSDSWFDDKPHIAVSQNSNNLGYVYLAFLVSGDPSLSGAKGLKVYRLTTSGGAWQDMTPGAYVVTGFTIHSPRVDIDPNDSYGTVYLSWVDYSSQTINVKTYTDVAGSWSSTSSASAGGTMIQPSATDRICSNNAAPNCVEGASMLTTRWNGTNNRLELVFHRRIASVGGSSAEVVHTTYAPGNVWGTPAVVSSNNPSHYSWNGAIACATDGTCLVVFYDMDPNELPSSSPGLAYRTVGRTLYTASSDTILYSSTAANPYAHCWTPFPAPPGAPCPTTGTGFFTPGEYQDVVYFNGAYTAATLYSTGSENKNDIFILKP